MRPQQQAQGAAVPAQLCPEGGATSGWSHGCLFRHSGFVLGRAPVTAESSRRPARAQGAGSVGRGRTGHLASP